MKPNTIVNWLFALYLGITSLHANQIDYQEQLNQAGIAAFKAMQNGPTTVNLQNRADLVLPKEFSYIPARETVALIKLMGNNSNGVMGSIAPNPNFNDGSRWFVILTYHDSGHIMDEDAKEWNADELLSSLKEGTEAANKIRRERGFGELHVLGWKDKPHYDEKTNRLLWSVKAKNSNQNVHTINLNTLALAKEGYISMNLVTQIDNFEKDRTISEKLLSSLNFKPGHQYGDFNEDTDRVAEYGLAALITGVAAKKLGFFALIALFLAKFGKALLVGLAVLGGIFYKKRKAAKKEQKQKDEENS